MASSLDGWIHNFTVTDVYTHRKGYSVYKITSIVFPVNIPETLTCVTVWKRFNEIKKLRKVMAKRHKELHLRGTMPNMKDENFFNRFDSQVIQQRKEFILTLLNFISQYPSLYKMHAFQNFFEISHSISSDDSPHHEPRSPIETICEEHDVGIQPNFPLIDPSRDELYSKNETPLSCSQDSSLASEDSCTSELNLNGCVEVEQIPASMPETVESVDQVDSSDYIYEAALSFSEAVRFEVNGNLRRAFDNYKRGIGILLLGSKHDVVEARKRIAKEKAKKYLARAEQIYEQYFTNDETNIANNIDASISNESSIERPIDQLARFKVIKILESVMQVQDSKDKEIFIIKAIEKPSSNNLPQMICLPRNIHFMVNLLAYFQSEATIYLLLQQASGGRLWDYIRSYEPTKQTSFPNRTESLASLFTEPNESKSISETGNESGGKSDTESPFMAMLNQYRSTEYSRSNSNQSQSSLSEVIESLESNADIPSFDILSQDMDVFDLVNCSQKLINSVSHTLDQSRSRQDSCVGESGCAIEQTTVNPTVNNQIHTLQSSRRNGESLRAAKTMNCGTQKRIPERSIKRWASEMVVCLLSLHEKDIFCGDLNPNNLLLGVKGQINLTYFYRQDQRQLKIECIDALYVAPERPLDYRSDWWSLGVLLFELLTGESFIACHPGGMSSYYEIQYPDVILSDESKDLLNELIQSDPDKRLSGQRVKNHRFFKGIKWDEVYEEGKGETKKCFSFIYCD
ncbi:Ribosomal protein S6 kinase-like 1 [Pseudolycoriella hygida]|uniref:Ribosomal protein S6 kinase-like 1 n=1 Tax=Pseudolycoriella hygida TaxID=35572 RepID=A0A9Q0MPQ4_9DIPT|nr:Ribosomal protein S6 kinase-like 1 [Pseudolycoriella hygida]